MPAVKGHEGKVWKIKIQILKKNYPYHWSYIQISVIFVIKLKHLKTSVHQSIQNSRNINIVSRPWNNSSCCATIKMEPLEDSNCFALKIEELRSSGTPINIHHSTYPNISRRLDSVEVTVDCFIMKTEVLHSKKPVVYPPNTTTYFLLKYYYMFRHVKVIIKPPL
jgi:hypothetical protein